MSATSASLDIAPVGSIDGSTGRRGRRRPGRRETGVRPPVVLLFSRAVPFRAPFAGAAAAARGRLDRATPRERVLLAGLGVAALAALPFAAQDWAAHRESAAAEDAGRLQALQAADDGARLRGASVRLAMMEARVRAWSSPAPSFAVARVLVEQQVAMAAAQAGATALEVRAAETPDVVGPARFVRVELSCAFSWAGEARLLARVAAARPGVVVERASTEGQGSDARLHLVLLAPFRTEAR